MNDERGRWGILAFGPEGDCYKLVEYTISKEKAYELAHLYTQESKADSPPTWHNTYRPFWLPDDH